MNEVTPMGKLILEKPNGEQVVLANTYHYPKSHKYEGLMMSNFWMCSGYMAKIEKVIE